MSGPPEAQHAWEETFHADDRGRPVAPRFHRLLMLDVRHAPTRPTRRGSRPRCARWSGASRAGPTDC